MVCVARVDLHHVTLIVGQIGIQMNAWLKQTLMSCRFELVIVHDTIHLSVAAFPYLQLWVGEYEGSCLNH